MNLYLVVETREESASAGAHWASELALKLKEGDSRVSVFLVDRALLTARTATAGEPGSSIGSVAERGAPADIIRLGEWAIDVPTRTISQGDRSSRVPPKAMRVLEELLDAGGAVVSRGRLMDAAWPDVTVGEEAVTHAVAELRRAFQQTSGGAAPLTTIYKSGYRLTETAERTRARLPEGDDLPRVAPFLAAQEAIPLFAKR